ncbi:hypothetical protein KIW84_046137 [Lathyrus oleraceus]|uniref:Uncharacterized protein n=1 Tax=Pisum sativum TaxID=3888 RepID=A0A9D4XQ50_PEA|nr:hypothetical protein KIW84_046137 [Pisum sativum]
MDKITKPPTSNLLKNWTKLTPMPGERQYCPMYIKRFFYQFKGLDEILNINVINAEEDHMPNTPLLAYLIKDLFKLGQNRRTKPHHQLGQKFQLIRNFLDMDHETIEASTSETAGDIEASTSETASDHQSPNIENSTSGDACEMMAVDFEAYEIPVVNFKETNTQLEENEVGLNDNVEDIGDENVWGGIVPKRCVGAA